MERPRFALFDSLRGLAVMGVLAFHVGGVSFQNVNAWYGGFTSHLNVGVTIFFLLSGFLLYRPYVQSSLLGLESPPIARYGKRRILRIVPAYWLALTGLAFWPGLPGVFTREWWVYYGFLQSYRSDWVWGGIAPAWSLSVEMAFYALLPLLGGALARLCRGRTPRNSLRLHVATLTALGAAGAGFHFASLALPLPNWGSSLPAFLLWFVAGMLLAVASVWLSGREHESSWAHLVIEHPSWCWGLALVLYTAIAQVPAFPRAFPGLSYTPVAHTVEHVLYAVVALLIMLPAVFGEKAGGLPRRVLGSRALTGLGVISYGVFLWHMPLLRAMAARGWTGLAPNWPYLSVLLSVLPVAVACSWLSYRLVERPAMQLGARQRPARKPGHPRGKAEA